MKMNIIITTLIAFLLICSIALNGFMYIHIDEQTMNIANMGEMQENTRQDLEKMKAGTITLENDNKNKTENMIKYQKANYYILAGDTALATAKINFADGFIYTAEIQEKNTIEYYKNALKLLKDVDKTTSDETLSIRIESQIHFVESAITYFEADADAIGFYILSIDVSDDSHLSDRYYDKYLDAYDEANAPLNTYNEAYLKMLSDADIVLES